MATTTDAQGHFSVTPAASYQCLKASHACYLTAQKDEPAGYVGAITLPGGYANGDNTINIADLAVIGSRYGSVSPTPPCADVNADGRVNIYDLTITASNFGRYGPVVNWQ